jgi:hypothetical protein
MHLDEEPEKKMSDGVVITPLAYLNIPERAEEVAENKSTETFSSNIKQSKWKIVKESTNRISSKPSKGEIKLSNLIDELRKFSIEKEIVTSEKFSINNSTNWIKISRQRLVHFLSQPRFHYFIIVLVMLDLMIVLVDLVLGMLFI